jgi:hypothetical protein
MSSVVAPVVELNLVERIAKIEESLKDLKRAARQELKARRRRSGRVTANGEKVAKGETPEQLKAWHEEVRKVWDEMRAADAKTPYKRAVAEASARRKGSPVAAVVAPVVADKKSKKASTSTSASTSATPVAAAPVAAPAAEKKRSVKKASA